MANQMKRLAAIVVALLLTCGAVALAQNMGGYGGLDNGENATGGQPPMGVAPLNTAIASTGPPPTCAGVIDLSVGCTLGIVP
jgi:hypothetical protein